jgi:hypothetical protein
LRGIDGFRETGYHPLMSIRQLNLGDFAEHCLDEIKAVQQGGTVVEILSSGKVVAVLSPPPAEEPEGTLADWIGSGAAITGDYSNLDQPCFMDVDDAQDFWNELSAQQYAALQRVPIIQRAEDLYGDGTAEEWEGFDEALEQWRSEKIPG